MKVLENIGRVFISNILVILNGIFISFIVPKILTVIDYGYYKTFTLYVSYAGICSLGLIDGIVLKFGAKDYEELKKGEFRAYFRWYLMIHIFWLVIFILGAICESDINRKKILLLLGIDLIALNLTGYFQQISQITQRFKEYSIRRILLSLMTIGVTLALFLFSNNGKKINYEHYIFCVILINYIVLVWYIFTYKDIIFGKSKKMMTAYSDIIQLMRQGFPLLFANLCSTAILLVDRQFVNFFFFTGEYAIYAFAYSILSVITVAVSAISTVLYPMLMRMKKNDLEKRYEIFLVIMIIFIFGIISAYFPLSAFINWYLPQYVNAVSVFRVILPGIALSSAITVIIHNYYKIFDKSFDYFKKSIVVLIGSVVANMVAYYIWKTMIAISSASIITIVFWYIYVDCGLKMESRWKCLKNVIYDILMTLMLYLITVETNEIVGFLVYILLDIAITIGFYGKVIKTVVLEVRCKRRCKSI